MGVGGGVVQLPLAAPLHKPKGEWRAGGRGLGLGGECAWQVCKISVQGECARWEVPHMGMGGCCAAASLHKSKGGWWAGVGGCGCECAR